MNKEKNLYDARKEKQLYFILSENVLQRADKEQLRKTAIIVHLYYEEDAEWYLEKLTVVPKEIDVYVISPNSVIREKAECYGFYVIEKKNRGRDISALLVAGKEIINKYEYVCFLHDKRKSEGCAVNDAKLWIENLWSNTIASEGYIQNVLNLLLNNPQIGLLVPPEPMGMDWAVWGINLWQEDYENTKELCEKIQLECNLSKYKPPITIGTVFWCKVKALKKLFIKKWKYEDFPEEPLALGGTVSHAIERVLGYVAQSEGYDVGTIVIQSYATKQMLLYHDFVGKALGEYLPLFGIRDVQNFDREILGLRQVKEFFGKHQKVYLYGAGKVGREGLRFLRKMGYKPSGFLVSENKTEEVIEQLPVYLREEITDWSKCGIIVTVGTKLRVEVERLIKSCLDCDVIVLEDLIVSWREYA